MDILLSTTDKYLEWWTQKVKGPRLTNNQFDMVQERIKQFIENPMEKTDLKICQNAILRMRKENPMELKNTEKLENIPEFTFFTFWEIITKENYQGTRDQALLWWNNQRNYVTR